MEHNSSRFILILAVSSALLACQSPRAANRLRIISAPAPQVAQPNTALAPIVTTIERTFRDLKHVLDLRPVYHRLSDRIRAHVLLCWLAMVLVRVAESETGETWPALRAEMGRHQLATITSKNGTVQHTSRPTTFQLATYKACKVDPPPKIHSMSAPRKA